MQILRSILAAVIAGTEPDLDINPAAQAYLQTELARNQAGGGEGGEGEGSGGKGRRKQSLGAREPAFLLLKYFNVSLGFKVS